MPKKQPKPEDIPTLEEIQKEWGPDTMSFFHDMVSSPEDQIQEEQDKEDSRSS
jgi:hypothetical protein